jgi:hypothetical protein
MLRKIQMFGKGRFADWEEKQRYSNYLMNLTDGITTKVFHDALILISDPAVFKQGFISCPLIQSLLPF